MKLGGKPRVDVEDVSAVTFERRRAHFSMHRFQENTDALGFLEPETKYLKPRWKNENITKFRVAKVKFQNQPKMQPTLKKRRGFAIKFIRKPEPNPRMVHHKNLPL